MPFVSFLFEMNKIRWKKKRLSIAHSLNLILLFFVLFCKGIIIEIYAILRFSRWNRQYGKRKDVVNWTKKPVFMVINLFNITYIILTPHSSYLIFTTFIPLELSEMNRVMPITTKNFLSAHTLNCAHAYVCLCICCIHRFIYLSSYT